MRGMGALKFAGNGMGTLRNRILTGLQRGGGGHGEGSRWGPGTQERAPGYLFNRTPPPTGQKRKWEDWELPYYTTGVLAVIILVVGLNAKPDTTLETWAHKKALERLQLKEQQQSQMQSSPSE
eukprot:TRINITY_DN33107_c0_g1_i1.p1 TRINITY_DN33107_c0_g1~~TRINITY_DN33107_c0_g1_i1.p1  ORF type:complete len:123 (-),score=16.28 TRINITY_DN33107_c0_g1_i1:37-405(-)